jgi:hypothetical protein
VLGVGSIFVSPASIALYGWLYRALALFTGRSELAGVLFPAGPSHRSLVDRGVSLQNFIEYIEYNETNKRIRGDQDETFKDLNKLGCFELSVRFYLHPHSSGLY